MTDPTDSKINGYADRFAVFFGSLKFIGGMSVFIVIWFLWNIFAPAGLQFDKYPFIFMTLLLSLQASYAAPIILFSQNRQAKLDRDKFDLDLEADVKSEKMLEKIMAKLEIPMEETNGTES
jgi:uncharacterized membrane protein